MPQPLLSDLIVIFALCALAVWLGQRLRQPAIVGFLLAGLLAGQHGLGLVKDVHTVEAAAELGVVLLMFTIGMEFSFRNLLQLEFAAQVRRGDCRFFLWPNFRFAGPPA